jgi:beta-glucanase (GH16 family)
MTRARWNLPDLTGWTVRPTADRRVSARCAWAKDDLLVMGLRKVGGQYAEAMVRTAQTFTGGQFSARMRFKGPQGAHAAFWLQSETPYASPGSHEVDVVEHFGQDNSVRHAVYGLAAERLFTARTLLDPYAWHTYTVDWRPDRYRFLLDGIRVAEAAIPTSRDPLFLVLSYLVSDWEVPDLDVGHLWRYRALVDWVEVNT